MNDVILQSFSLEDSQTSHVILYKHTAITVCGHRLTLENHVFLNNLNYKLYLQLSSSISGHTFTIAISCIK
jgi:hypothetical protein